MKTYKKKKGGGIVGRILTTFAILAVTAGVVSVGTYFLAGPTDSPNDTSSEEYIPVGDIELDESEVIF